jgi:hypothetical protein
LRLPTRLPLLWRIMVLSLTLGTLLARGHEWLDGAPFRGVPTLFVTALAVPSVLLWYYGFAGRAGERGLKLFDNAGFPRRVGWDEIASAQLQRWPYMLWAPALRVVLADGRVRWLPRETQGLGELHALALRVRGPGHPLVKALETPLHRL